MASFYQLPINPNPNPGKNDSGLRDSRDSGTQESGFEASEVWSKKQTVEKTISIKNAKRFLQKIVCKRGEQIRCALYAKIRVVT